MLDEKHAGELDTRIVEEMGVWSGSVRIDIAVINGSLSGFELKSDRDTLQRLPLQTELYSHVFDRMDLVVGCKHADKAVDILPDWWGVIEATSGEGGVELRERRTGASNPSPNPYLIAQLLWKSEVLALLESRGLAAGWRSKRIKVLHERAANELPLPELRAAVRSFLKQRQGWLRQVGAGQLNVPANADSDPML